MSVVRKQVMQIEYKKVYDAVKVVSKNYIHPFQKKYATEIVL